MGNYNRIAGARSAPPGTETAASPSGPVTFRGATTPQLVRAVADMLGIVGIAIAL